MKNTSEIASALRAKGRKFSQTSLISALKVNCTPIVQHGRTVIYEDEALDAMLAIFPDRSPQQATLIEPSQEIEVLKWPDDDRIANIEKMLGAICKDLNIAIH